MWHWTGLAAAAVLAIATLPAPAQDREVALAASADLVESGLMKYVLPRFSLKTSIRLSLGDYPPGGAAEVVIGPSGEVEGGTAIFQRDGTIYAVSVLGDGSDHALRFRDWLTGETGQRTILAYAPEGVALYAAAPEVEEVAEAIEITADAIAGEALSHTHCGRCHVVSERNRMNSIGSTPSFFVLRTLPNWEDRFLTFYLLKPHPSFTQIEGITEPFDETLPSPIYPLSMVDGDIDAILAYVLTLPPADLGAPVKLQ